MRANLRIAATFADDIAVKFGVPGLKEATIIDDANGLLHKVEIEYVVDEESDQLYRRLNYQLISMSTMKKVGVWQNDIAEQLLQKIVMSLSGSTISDGRHFEKSMILLPKGQMWDDNMPAKKRTPPKKDEPLKDNGDDNDK